MAASCEELALSPPQIHALLRLADRLGDGQLVERVRDAEDRRVVEVRLTARGRDTAERIKYAVAERIESLLALLDTDDREALFGIVERLIRRLEETRRR